MNFIVICWGASIHWPNITRCQVEKIGETFEKDVKLCLDCWNRGGLQLKILRLVEIRNLKLTASSRFFWGDGIFSGAWLYDSFREGMDTIWIHLDGWKWGSKVNLFFMICGFFLQGWWILFMWKLWVEHEYKWTSTVIQYTLVGKIPLWNHVKLQNWKWLV